MRAILVLAISMLLAGAAGAQEDSTPAGRAASGGADRGGRFGGRKAPLGRLINPASPAARLMLASPEQRERALESLPPERQEVLRRNLAWFDSLPPGQQAIQIRRLERFAQLSPAQKRLVNRQMQALNRIPPPRRALIRRALQNLQILSEEQRQVRMNSQGFKNRFSPEERQIIADLCDAWLPPM